MKTISVSLTEKIPYTYRNDRWNKETQKWEEYEEVEMKDYFTFYDLASAKKFIKAHMDVYKDSCITKVWANGDWENLGPVKVKGNNKHFVANTRQTISSYA